MRHAVLRRLTCRGGSTPPWVVGVRAALGLAFAVVVALFGAALPRPHHTVAVDLPDLVVTQIAITPDTSGPSAYQVTVSVKNQGTGAATWTPSPQSPLPPPVQLWVSADASLSTATDTNLGFVRLPPTISPGIEATIGTTVVSLPGSCYVFAWVDYSATSPNGAIAESNEGNNVLSVPYPPGTPDLRAGALVAPAAADVGTTIQVTYTVDNVGTASASPRWNDEIFLSPDPVLGGNDVAGQIVPQPRTLPAGGSYSPTVSFAIPLLPAGTYYLVFGTNTFRPNPDVSIAESGYDNNTSAAVPILLRAVDLVVTDATVSPANARPGETITFSYTVTNAGDAPAIRHASLALGTGWLDGLQLSTDTTYRIGNSATTRVFSGEDSPERLEPGASYSRTGTRTIPADLPDGTWRLLVETDTNHNVGVFRNVYEGEREANNVRAATPVLVVDTTPPVIEAHADVTAEASDADGARVEYDNPATHDAVDGDGVADCNPVSGSLFALGETIVTCTAIDSHGNAAAPTTFKVRVVDTTGPTLTVPADQTVEATSAAGATVDAPAGFSATDTVDPSLTITCRLGDESGEIVHFPALFPLGTTIVSCKARDASDNKSPARTFKVTVVDTTPPVIAGLPSDLTLEETGTSGAAGTWPAPTATDVVDTDVAVTCHPQSGATFPLGTTTVTCTATDDAGNTAAGSFAVTVVQPASQPVYVICPLFDQTKAVKAGAVKPIKVQLCDAAGTNLSASDLVLHAVGLQRVDRTASAQVEDPGRANSPDHNFRYDDGYYVFNLDTAGLSTGTWELQFTVAGDDRVYAVRFDVR